MLLQHIRKDAGLSQGKLADKSGVNVRMIQYYEQGVKDINGAKLETLINLSEALNCKISDILTNEELIKKAKNHSI